MDFDIELNLDVDSTTQQSIVEQGRSERARIPSARAAQVAEDNTETESRIAPTQQEKSAPGGIILDEQESTTARSRLSIGDITTPPVDEAPIATLRSASRPRGKSVSRDIQRAEPEAKVASSSNSNSRKSSLAEQIVGKSTSGSNQSAQQQRSSVQRGQSLPRDSTGPLAAKRVRNRTRGFSPETEPSHTKSKTPLATSSGSSQHTRLSQTLTVETASDSLQNSIDPIRNSSDQVTPRRNPRLSHITPEWEGSLFTKPAQAVRQRLKTVDRYSPPLDVPSKKPRWSIASCLNKTHEGEQSSKSQVEQQREVLDFRVFGDMVRAQLEKDGIIDFELPEDYFPKNKEKTPKNKDKRFRSTSSANANKKSDSPKQKQKDVLIKAEPENSDDEAEEATGPIVRMADIGAAPFNPIMPSSIKSKPKTLLSSKKTKTATTTTPQSSKGLIGHIRLPKKKSIDSFVQQSEDIPAEASSSRGRSTTRKTPPSDTGNSSAFSSMKKSFSSSSSSRTTRAQLKDDHGPITDDLVPSAAINVNTEPLFSIVKEEPRDAEEDWSQATSSTVSTVSSDLRSSRRRSTRTESKDDVINQQQISSTVPKPIKSESEVASSHRIVKEEKHQPTTIASSVEENATVKRKSSRRSLAPSIATKTEEVPSSSEETRTPILSSTSTDVRPQRLSAGKSRSFMAEVIANTSGRRTKKSESVATPDTTQIETISTTTNEADIEMMPIEKPNEGEAMKEEGSSSSSSKHVKPVKIKEEVEDNITESFSRRPSLSVRIRRSSRRSSVAPSPPSTPLPHSVDASSTSFAVPTLSPLVIETTGSDKSATASPVYNVRRSSRSQVPTSKIRDKTATRTSTSSNISDKNIDPDSALGILQRASKFQRPPRSPSPSVATCTPSPSTSRATSRNESIMKTGIENEAEQIKKGDTDALVTKVDDDNHEHDQGEEHEVNQYEANFVAVEQPEQKKEDLDNPQDEVPLKKAKTSKKENKRRSSKTSTNDAKIDTSEQNRHEDKCIVPSHQDDVVVEKTEKTPIPSPSVAPITPVPSTSEGRSRRIVKPSRFLDDNFVTPTPRVILTKERKEPKKSTEAQEKAVEETLEERVETRVEAQEEEVIDTSQVDDTVQMPNISSVQPKKSITKPTPALTMKTRRRSSIEQHAPIRLKLRIGNASKVEIIQPSEEPNVEKEEEEPLLNMKQSKKAMKLPSIWQNYVPSIKPVLESIQCPDGTWENLGISVGSVMDRLLLEVCQDGIARHSSIISEKERKRRNGEKVRQKYLEQKAAIENLREEMIQRGEKPLSWTRYLNLGQNKLEQVMSKHRDRGIGKSKESRARKELSKTHSEYHFPDINRPSRLSELERKAQRDESRRIKTRKALDYLSKNFEKETDEALKEGVGQMKRRKGLMPSPDYVPEASSSHDVVDNNQHEKPQQQKPKQVDTKKEKKARPPLALNDYLSTKTASKTNSFRLLPESHSTEISQDFFYREIVSNVKETEEDDADGILDVGENIAPPPISEESSEYLIPPPCEISAVPYASEIERLMMRPMGHDGVQNVSDMYERAREEPELHRALLDHSIEVITSQYVSEASSTSCDDASSLRQVTSMKNAALLRDVLHMFSIERQQSVYWLHRFLIENLPVHFLSSYLVLLRYGKGLVHSGISTIVKSTISDFEPWNEVTKIIQDYISNRTMMDPEMEQLNRTIVSNSMSDVVFLLVSPAMTVGDYQCRARYHETIFKWLRQLAHSESNIMKIVVEDEGRMTIAQSIDIIVDRVLNRVRQLVKIHRHKRIVLVGWGTTCFINHRVTQMTHGVSAIIDFGFPVLTGEGSRGTPDDDICLTYCPTLFIVGAEACDFDPVAMKELRANMIEPSGLIVVGRADNNLHVSALALSQLHITQKTVNRIIVEQVVAFLSLEETKKERSHLIQMDINPIYDIDPNMLREKQPSVAPIRRTSRDEEAEERKRKRKLTADNTPLSSVPVSPEIAPQPITSMTSEAARYRFDSLMKKTTALNDSKRPRIEERRMSEFKEPYIPSSTYRASPLASPLSRPSPPSFPSSSSTLPPPPTPPPPPPLPSSGLVDPASISLS